MTYDSDPAPAADLLAHAEGVRRLARSLVRDAHRAEDVAQETLARAVEKPPREGWPLRAWLAGVARHVAATAARGERRRAERERRAARPEATPSAADAVARVAEQRRVLDAVLALEEDARVVVVLRFFEGLPPRAIARRLGIPVETVRTRLRRALARLRARLDEEHGDRRRALFALVAVAAWKPATWVVVPGLGAIAMKKVVLLLVLVLGLGVAGWRLFASGAGGAGGAGAVPVPAERTEGEASVPGLSTAPPPAAVAAVDAAPPIGPDVDLASADRDLDLHGVVVRESGAPVAGADVRTFSYPARRVQVLDYDTYFTGVDGPSTRTSKDGAFRLRLRRGEKVHLLVAAAGLAPAERPDCLAGERVRMVMRPAVRLIVVVRDASGAPVPGTALRLFRAPHEVDLAFERRAVADADGRATFADLPSATQATLEAVPQVLGNPGWRRIPLPSEGETSFVLELPVGQEITGRVTDAETGAPIAGARVGLDWVLARSVRTDADGRYALPGWTKDVGAVNVVADGYGREARRVGGTYVLDFGLARGAVVKGRLVTPEGEGIGKARVDAIGYARAGRTDESLSVRPGRSEANGRFRIEGLRKDLPHSLVVQAEGRGRTLLDFDPAVAEGGVMDVGDVVLRVGLRVEGRVEDADGTPKARVVVQLRGTNGDRTRLRGGGPALDFHYGARESCFTDDLGRFRFRDLAAGTYSLSASPPGEAVLEGGAEVKDADVLGVVLRAAAGRSLRVHVTDETGAPVAGAMVSLTDPVAGTWRGMAKTGADGVASFTVPRDRPVSAYATVPPAAGGRVFLAVTPVRVESGTEEARIVLPEAAVVSGRVVDARGGAIVGLEVTASRGGRTIASAFAGPDGRFEMTVATGGPVDLALGAQLAREGRFEISTWEGGLAGVAIGARDVVLRASPAVADKRLRVVVLDPEGKPAPDVTVIPAPEWGGRVVVGPRTDAAGAVEWEGLVARPGSVVVSPWPESAGAGRWLVQTRGPVVPDGQTLTVRLVAGVRVAGTVLGPDGAPAARVNVQAHRDAETVGAALSGDDGTFAILLDPVKHFPVALQADDPTSTLQAVVEGLRGPAEGLVLRLAKKP